MPAVLQVFPSDASGGRISTKMKPPEKGKPRRQGGGEAPRFHFTMTQGGGEGHRSLSAVSGDPREEERGRRSCYHQSREEERTGAFCAERLTRLRGFSAATSGRRRDVAAVFDRPREEERAVRTLNYMLR